LQGGKRRPPGEKRGKPKNVVGREKSFDGRIPSVEDKAKPGSQKGGLRKGRKNGSGGSREKGSAKKSKDKSNYRVIVLQKAEQKEKLREKGHFVKELRRRVGSWRRERL